MYIISPLSRCANPEKRDTFISHISQIAAVTFSEEPGCHGYAWFVSAEDNDDDVPAHWIRGFEIYRSAEDNTVAHRASDEYKAFRKAVAEQNLLEKPSDLRFWHPTNIGFLTREQQVVFASSQANGDRQYIVVDEIMPHMGKKLDILSRLEDLATESRDEKTLLTFWVLDRGAPRKDISNAGDDDGIFVIARFRDKSSYKDFQGHFGDASWKEIDAFCEKRLTTTWVEAGLGFLGR